MSGQRKKRVWEVRLTSVFSVIKKIKYQWLFFTLILTAACFIRLFHFPYIPAGFNQDEAAIAYDSYSLLNYGIDRNGYSFPVYPVSWGAGQGPFYMYFAIPFMWLFGDGVFGFRIGNVILSLISIVCIFFAMKNSFSVREGLIAMFLFAISPWNIILSRWALDANPLPSLFMIAVCFLSYAINTGKTYAYLLTASMFAVSLYSYGTSYVVIPLFLLFTIPYLLYHKKITWKQTILSGFLFLLFAFPLILFILVNYFDLKEIRTAWFSVPKLTALRSADIFRNWEGNTMSQIMSSMKECFEHIVLQKSSLPWNSESQYKIIYRFSSIFILIAIPFVFFKSKLRTFSYYYIYFVMFISGVILTLLIEPNVNRIHIVFVPLLCLITLVLSALSRYSRYIFRFIIGVYCVSFLSFSNFYINEYNDIIGSMFYESYDEAILYAAEETTGSIYISENLHAAYIRTLFHVKTDPHVFLDTVQYQDQYAAFRMALSFDRYIFSLPETITADAYYVILNTDADKFDADKFAFEEFKYFTVVSPKIMPSVQVFN